MSSIPISPALSRPRSPSLPYSRLPPSSSGPPATKREREREERLINAYEAEEERIINVLSRKLEQLREEKITLERVHEEEDEARVNRLARELAVLRVRQHQQQQQQQQQAQYVNGSSAGPSGGGSNWAGPSNSDDGLGVGTSSGLSATAAFASGNGNAGLNGALHPMNGLNGIGPPDPSSEVLLNALTKENVNLRSRLGTVEREYVRLTRLNEVYREELIQHRRRLGLSVDNLIGLSNAVDAYSQPTHRRAPSTASTSSSSPTASMVALPSLARPSATTHSMPIPRNSNSTSSASRRAQTLGMGPGTSTSSIPIPIPIPESPLSNPSHPSSAASTSASVSASASPDLSPILSALPASYASGATNLTTPPSSASLRETLPAPYGTPGAGSAVVGLSYPSVPPPSLSSSLGSPVVATHHIPSPVPVSGQAHGGQRHGQGQSQWNERRFSGGFSHTHSHSHSNSQGQGSRRTSVERGARIAETGSLVRSRAGSGASASHTHSALGSSDGTGTGFVPSLGDTRESE